MFYLFLFFCSPIFLDDESFLNRREFSFTLPGDIYLRYQSFKNSEELLKGLATKLPIKIDIGAVFDKVPKDNRKTLESLIPQERELIFDIDMNDYDDIRTCCKGAVICKMCWRFIVIAAKILDRALREDFDFKNILWVYSGRRGIHGWVCDARARKLSQDARSAIVDYLSLVEGGEYKSKRVTLPANKNLHPSVKKSLDLIKSEFVDFMIKDQKLFDTTESASKVIDLCLDSELKLALRSKVLKSFRTGIDRWEVFEKTVELFVQEKNYTRTHARYYLDEIKLQMCYPRLDVNVSRGMNHLIKSPFCVHPKTHRVCVPVEMDKIEKFDPFTVPTIDQLCSEIDAHDAANPEKTNIDVYDKTSLKELMKFFRLFVSKCERDEAIARAAEARATESLDC